MKPNEKEGGVLVSLWLISPTRTVPGCVAAIAARLNDTDGDLQDLYCRHDVMLKSGEKEF